MLEFTRGEQAQDRWREALRLAKERGVLRLAQEAQARGIGKGDRRFDGRWVRAIGLALEVFTEGLARRRVRSLRLRLPRPADV